MKQLTRAQIARLVVSKLQSGPREPRSSGTEIFHVSATWALQSAEVRNAKLLKFTAVGVIAAFATCPQTVSVVVGLVADAYSAMTELCDKVAQINALQRCVLLALRGGGLTAGDLRDRLNAALSDDEEWSVLEIEECLASLTTLQRNDGTIAPFVMQGADSLWRSLA